MDGRVWRLDGMRGFSWVVSCGYWVVGMGIVERSEDVMNFVFCFLFIRFY